jgi:acetoin utilization protein AcuB
MLVRDYMIKHPPMVEPDVSMFEAQRLMTENHVRHLPVVKDGKRLLGLVTRQSMMMNPGRLASLDVWDISRTLSNVKVTDVMVKARSVLTTDPDTPVEQAAHVMVQNQIGCLPVVSEGVIVGLITENDLLNLLTEMMGGRVPGVRVTVRMPMNVKGELAKLTTAIASQGWAIEAMGGAVCPRDPDKWDAVVKIREPKDRVVAALSAIQGQTVIDVREY